MAERSQSADFRRRIEELIADERTEEAYELLVKEGWVKTSKPSDVYQPKGLKLYAEVDDERWVMTDINDWYWAWKVVKGVKWEITPIGKAFSEPDSTILRNLLDEGQIARFIKVLTALEEAEGKTRDFVYWYTRVCDDPNFSDHLPESAVILLEALEKLIFISRVDV